MHALPVCYALLALPLLAAEPVQPAGPATNPSGQIASSPSTPAAQIRTALPIAKPARLAQSAKLIQAEGPKKFPAHWGAPPRIQTRDYVKLPGGYGHGSSTLKKWIQENLDKDAANKGPDLQQPSGKDGDGSITISGELKQWHKVTLTLDGPFAHEQDNRPNPFTDYALQVTFTHESGSPKYTVPGYFAADGNAAESSAQSGTKWRAHLSPDKPGQWTYTVSFLTAPNIISGETDAVGRIQPLHGKTGSFTIAPTDKSGRDFRAQGRLTYVGKHHLQFAGSKEYFLKAGADAPETLFGYADFDGTSANKAAKVPLKHYKPHLADWKAGDPSWQDGKGKGLIGALNYLSSTGANAFSFLPYNAGGDGDNVWPFTSRDDPLHYDCSKLDQWALVLDHATATGLFAHFKMQETENDDNVPTALDGGDLGPERRLYCRELIARFGHLLALNWNLGEENTQSTKQQLDMAHFIAATDPYHHHIVVHTFPDQQDKVYRPLLGQDSPFTGASLQTSTVRDCHAQIVKWTEASTKAGKPWGISFDEPGDAQLGMPPDPDYPGMPKNYKGPSIHDTRKYVLWGTFLGGGWGVEYYFGYKLPQNDLLCEDWRSRDQSWRYCKIALNFFRGIPFQDMTNHDELVGNTRHDNSAYCYAKKGLYLVYLPEGGSKEFHPLPNDAVKTIQWFNPRNGILAPPSPLKGNKLAAPDQDDWLAILKSPHPQGVPPGSR